MLAGCTPNQFPNVALYCVEAGGTRARELQDAFAHALGQTAGAGPAAAGVCQRRLTALPIARFQTLHMPDG